MNTGEMDLKEGPGAGVFNLFLQKPIEKAFISMDGKV